MTNTNNSPVTVNYSVYTPFAFKTSGWSQGGSKYVSGTRYSGTATISVFIGRQTELAMEFVHPQYGKCWVPKSTLTTQLDGSLTVSKGFCYRAGFPNWKQSRPVQRVRTLESVSKEMSETTDSLKGWNGHGRRGASAYDRMFELEQAESDLMYCDCGTRKKENEKHCWSCSN